MLTVAFVLVAWIATGMALLLVLTHRPIRAALAEPVLAAPVLIFESDDWGPGPVEDAGRLNDLAETLAGFRDVRGRHPVVALGMVLSEPDRERIRSSNLGEYHRRSLDLPQFQAILDAARQGVARGVFSVQLHGLEHCWPEALLAAAGRDPRVAQWLSTAEPISIEALPSALQTRWADCSTLPSRPLSARQIDAAVAEETAAFRKIFGEIPAVAVPPTFVWTPEVELAWRRLGVDSVVTPGRRYETRGSDGRPASPSADIYSGQLGPEGILYLVRDVYFEPSRGHCPERVLVALAERIPCGRPVLVETHRFNFTGQELECRHSLDALHALLEGALHAHPQIRFMSSSELAGILRNRHGELIESRLVRRARAYLTRLYGISRVRKALWLSGLILPGWLLWRLATLGTARKNTRLGKC